MRRFNILFYKSADGELSKMLQFEKVANSLQDLVSDPPEEFLEALLGHVPIHGWAEVETNHANIFVIFIPRNNMSPRLAGASGLTEIDLNQFHQWLNTISPKDLSEDD